MQIKKIMLRYYVPFSFVCTSIDQYHDICESCGNLFGVATVPITSEDDFFDNIGDLYELNSSAAIGTFFSASNIELPKLISQDKNFSVEINIKRLRFAYKISEQFQRVSSKQVEISMEAA